MTHILITGANRGIGLGFVRKYIEKNLHLTCITRDISGSKELLAFKEKYPNKKICLVDERFTSKIAQKAIFSSGVKKTKRKDKSLVDKVSATIILQDYLNSN